MLGRGFLTHDDNNNTQSDDMINERKYPRYEDEVLQAIETDDLAALEYLIFLGADVNKCTIIYKGNVTPLLNAAWKDNNEALRLLLQAGADVNMTDKRNMTPLLIASSQNNTEAIQLLLNNGASINAKNYNDTTALLYCAQSNNIKAAKLLIEKGANVNCINRNKMSPLMYATQYRNIQMINLYLKHGASICLTFKGVHSLQHISRMSVRNALAGSGATSTFPDKVSALFFPQKLKRYIMLADIGHMMAEIMYKHVNNLTDVPQMQVPYSL